MSLGGFSVAMTNLTEKEMETKILLEFNKQLLKLYKYRFVEEQRKSMAYKIATKESQFGLPLLVICAEYTMQGYYKVVDGQDVLEKVKIDYTNQCSMAGRIVNGYLTGKGSFRMSNGNMFRGEILSKKMAIGEIVDGYEVTRGRFLIEIKGNVRNFVPYGLVELFSKGGNMQSSRLRMMSLSKAGRY